MSAATRRAEAAKKGGDVYTFGENQKRPKKGRWAARFWEGARSGRERTTRRAFPAAVPPRCPRAAGCQTHMQGQHGRRRASLLLLALVGAARQADGVKAAPLHTRLTPGPTPLPAPVLSPNASLARTRLEASASPPNVTATTTAATNATAATVARRPESTLFANLRRLLLFRVGWEAAEAPAGAAVAALAAPANGTLTSEQLADGASELSSRLSLAARLEQAVPQAVPPPQQRGAHDERGERTEPKPSRTTADVMNRPAAARCLRFDRAGGCATPRPTVPMQEQEQERTAPMQQQQQEEESTVRPLVHDDGPDPRLQDDRGKGDASLSAAAAIASQALAADFNAVRGASF